MILLKFENLLGNISFGVLLFTMLVYWFRSAFFISFNNINSFLKHLGFLGIVIANLTLASLLICRWINSNHFPLSNLYESLIFLAWAISLVLLILDNKIKENFFGLIFSPILLFIDAFATLTLPQQMQENLPLVPALKSNWLIMHVSIMLLSYAALIAGSLIAIVFLILCLVKEKKFFNQPSVNTLTNIDENQQIALDNLSYRTLGIGFPLLTLGILSGAIWANEAWGSYWSWDPKETWALITWLVFAIYFHFRITLGWQGKKPALIASFGFIVVWICYLGVNILGTGLHSYGWLNS
jgi:cytochrome c-type biogenesis protein CcsB